jgi:hypothetical protein
MVIGLGQQRLSVALGERTVAEQVDRVVGELEQPNGVREVAAAASEPSGQQGGGDVQVVQERCDRAGLLDHGQVFAGDVLDQRELERHRAVDRVVDERWDRWPACDL